tara:strand:+ start:193 stop:441 length:249 start_codon:yes stop_codon:yes gene_type:complete
MKAITVITVQNPADELNEMRFILEDQEYFGDDTIDDAKFNEFTRGEYHEPTNYVWEPSKEEIEEGEREMMQDIDDAILSYAV